MASLTAADTSWSVEMLLEEPANERTPDVSGAWLAVNADTMDLDALLEEEVADDDIEYALDDAELEPCWDEPESIQQEPAVVELSEDSLIDDEEPEVVVAPPRRAHKPRKPPSWKTSSRSKSASRSSDDLEARLAQTVVAAGKGRLASVSGEQQQAEELSEDELIDVVEGTISLNDGDLEVMEPESNGRIEPSENGTLLFYCRPGDSLPPALVPTNELPRFAVPRGRLPQVPERLPQFSIADGLPESPFAGRSARLPQFSIPPEPVRKHRVPPVRLPRFPIEEMRPRPPAPRRRPAPLPAFGQHWPQHAAAPQAWPLYQAAASGSWPAHQSGEFPSCPHCREQMLLAAAWSAAPALFGWGMARR